MSKFPKFVNLGLFLLRNDGVGSFPEGMGLAQRDVRYLRILKEVLLQKMCERG